MYKVIRVAECARGYTSNAAYFKRKRPINFDYQSALSVRICIGLFLSSRVPFILPASPACTPRI